ncbi:Guanine nucleotide-binding-like protein 1 [Dinochytrium kinnereticum]|nr:Guanine nucleotide-binding-like protein 1 [Dinochytrium kinnereticum]
MHRKKPFSAKQKKAQLLEKRARSRAHTCEDKDSSNNDDDGPTAPRDAVQVADEEGLPTSNPLGRPKLKGGFDDLYPDNKIIDFPKRPPWSRSELKEELEAKEEKSFDEWMKRIYASWDAEGLSFFEHNLEVWRQLWRVVEISDIILFVVDSRHPILHFPPSLYDYIVNQMKKKLVLVFNKIDLVDTPTLKSWTTYFHNRFPTLHTATFSIYPKQVHLDATPLPAAHLLHSTRTKASRKVPRFSRSVGVATVLRACRDVEIVKGGVAVDWEGMIEEEEEKRRRWEEEERRRVEEEMRVEREMGAGARRRRGRGRGGGEGEEEEEEEEEDEEEGSGEAQVGIPEDIEGHYGDEGMYKIAQVQEPYSSVQYLAERVPIEEVLKLRPPEDANPATYKWTAWDICESYAIAKGFLTSRAGRPDVYRSANMLLRMANDGRLLMSFKPPDFFAKLQEERACLAVGGLKEGRQKYVENEEGVDEEEEEDECDDEEIGVTGNAFALLDTGDD